MKWALLAAAILLAVSVFFGMQYLFVASAEIDSKARAKLNVRARNKKLDMFERLEVLFGEGGRRGIVRLPQRLEKLVQRSRKHCAAAGFSLSVTLLIKLGIAISLATAVACFVLSGSLLIGVIAFFLAPLALHIFLQIQASKRTNKLREQLPAVIRSMEVSLASGRSIQQAFQDAAREAKKPFKAELELTAAELVTGTPIRISMVRMKERVPVHELGLVVTAIAIQHESGGSLHELFADVSRSISESIALMRELQVKTSQARLSSRVVVVMPFAIFILIGLVSPNYYDAFFSSSVGIVAFCSAVVLDALGLLAIKRISAVEV